MNDYIRQLSDKKNQNVSNLTTGINIICFLKNYSSENTKQFTYIDIFITFSHYNYCFLF